MTIFQIVLLIVTVFFIYKIFEYMQNFEPKTSDKKPQMKKNSYEEIDEMILNADASYERGDLQTALNLLENAHRHDSSNTEILNKLAFILAKDNQTERAIKEYKNSLVLNNSDDLVHNAIASLYKEQKMYDLAKQHYKKALEIDENYDITYYNYGNLLQETEEKEEAIKMYQKALELNPSFKEAKEELEKLL